MPKKTKKEKLIAEYRRKLSVISHPSEPIINGHMQNASQVASKSTITATGYTFSQPRPKNIETVTTTFDLEEFSFIRKDLLVTLILIASMLIVEFFVWKLIG